MELKTRPVVTDSPKVIVSAAMDTCEAERLRKELCDLRAEVEKERVTHQEIIEQLNQQLNQVRPRNYYITAVCLYVN